MIIKRNTFQKLLFEQQILGILLFTLLVVIVWVGSSVYFTFAKTTLTQEDIITVQPLDPALNIKPVQVLATRKWWKDEELKNFPLSIENDSKLIPIKKTSPATTSAQIASASATIAP